MKIQVRAYNGESLATFHTVEAAEKYFDEHPDLDAPQVSINNYVMLGWDEYPMLIELALLQEKKK